MSRWNPRERRSYLCLDGVGVMRGSGCFAPLVAAARRPWRRAFTPGNWPSLDGRALCVAANFGLIRSGNADVTHVSS
jgi:hypothetical protein